MKYSHIPAAFFASCVGTYAADDAALRFGGDQIESPPTSLRESIAPLLSKPSLARAPELLFSLLPRPRQIAATISPRPQITRSAGMPVITPSDAIDYKMKIVPHDPNIDPKFVIKLPDAKETK
jgi:hypothetical protein